MAKQDFSSQLGNFQSLRFPDNVGTDEVPAYIRFVPQKVEYGGTKGLNPVNRPSLKYGLTDTASKSMGGAVEQAQNQIGGAVQSFATAAKEAVNSIGNVFKGTSFSQITNDLGKLVSGKINLGIFNINLGTKTEPDTIQTLGSINIYLPNELMANAGVNYSAKEVGQTGAIAAQKFQSVDDLSKADIGEIAGGVVGDKIKSLVSNSTVGAIMPMATGKVFNNFSFQVFEGVGHRKFAYNFRMVPKSEKEAVEIKNICDTFLFLMLPGRSQANLGDVNVQFFDIPCQWQIEYQYKGNKMKYHIQPGICFLESVEVQYGGDTGNNLYNDGAPMETTMTLSFVEIEPLYRGRSDVRCEPGDEY